MDFPKYLIINKAEDEATIDIFGDIGESFFSESFSKQNLLERFTEIGNVSKINVNISSFGGSLNDGIVIYDLLREHPARITTKVYGMTASAATVIAQAGNERLISENAMYLVHQPMILTAGNINDHKENLELLESAQEQLISIYNKRTKKSKKELRELIEENNGNGKWLTAKEAVEFGFADSTFEPSSKGMKNFSKEIMNQYKLPEINNDMDKTILDRLDEMFNNFIAKLTPSKEEEKPVENKANVEEIQNAINEVKATNIELQNKVDILEAEKQNYLDRITALEEIETKFNALEAKGTVVKGLEGQEDHEANLPEEVKSLRADMEKIKLALNPPEQKLAPINTNE